MTPPGPRRIVLAPNAFKGTFDAVEVSRLWREALEARSDIVAEAHPLSDGGNGFLSVLERALPDLLGIRARVRDPLGRSVNARWAWDPGSAEAFLESAEAVGIELLAEEERAPAEATSHGLGQLLQAAVGIGARTIVVGLGGSATVDGGLGMGRALGYRYEAADGRPILRPRDLPDLARVAPPPGDPLGGVTVVALADVRNPLLGPDGAAPVFGPQKGAGPDEVARLEVGLERSAQRWVADLGSPGDLPDRSGAGAAGGLGAALVALAGARLEWGPAWIADRTGVADALVGASGVITGEGRFDAQSAGDKATGWLLDAAARRGIPVAVVAGEIAPDARRSEGVTYLDARAIGRSTGDRLDPADLAALARRALEGMFGGGR